MPGYDGKGPDGQGPKTGRGLGNCGPKGGKKPIGGKRPRRGQGRRPRRGIMGQNRQS
jgi:hypothetical protein